MGLEKCGWPTQPNLSWHVGRNQSIPDPKEWLGVFSDRSNELPLAVFQARYVDSLLVGSKPKRWWLLFHISIFSALPTSRALAKMRPQFEHGANGK